MGAFDWINTAFSNPATLTGSLDVIRVLHFAAIAIGFGTVVSTDILSLRRIGSAVSEEYCQVVESAQSIIVPSLSVAWFTGVLLLIARTGLDLAAFTADLWAKLLVVTILTATAYVVRFRVLPAIRRNVGRTLLESDLSDTKAMATCTGLSAGGWVSALVLSGLGASGSAPLFIVMATVAVIHLAILAVVLRSAVSLHRRIDMENRIVERHRLGFS